MVGLRRLSGGFEDCEAVRDGLGRGLLLALFCRCSDCECGCDTVGRLVLGGAGLWLWEGTGGGVGAGATGRLRWEAEVEVALGAELVLLTVAAVKLLYPESERTSTLVGTLSWAAGAFSLSKSEGCERLVETLAALGDLRPWKESRTRPSLSSEW
jgi:hypothetical protein